MSERPVNDRVINDVEGTALPLRGDDLDTDRIVPARYLRAVTFEGFENHVFVDDRRQAAEVGRVHPFSNPAYQGASILIVNRNFGCGSSREHAPRALRRWGIRAIVGESFSEIFEGNALAIGLPCLTADADRMEALMQAVESAPATRVSVSLADRAVTAGDLRVPVALPPAARDAFLEGAWDATGLLLDRFEEVEAVAKRLPYLTGFARQETRP